MNLGLDGKRALVTGSTAGIGFAAANALRLRARTSPSMAGRLGEWMPRWQNSGEGSLPQRSPAAPPT